LVGWLVGMSRSPNPELGAEFRIEFTFFFPEVGIFFVFWMCKCDSK